MCPFAVKVPHVGLGQTLNLSGRSAWPCQQHPMNLGVQETHLEKLSPEFTRRDKVQLAKSASLSLSLYRSLSRMLNMSC